MTDLEHSAKMQAADEQIAEAKKARWEAARRLAAADRKYRTYAKATR